MRRAASLLAVPGGPTTKTCSRATAPSATSSTRCARSTKPRVAASIAARTAVASCSTTDLASLTAVSFSAPLGSALQAAQNLGAEDLVGPAAPDAALAVVAAGEHRRQLELGDDDQDLAAVAGGGVTRV